VHTVRMRNVDRSGERGTSWRMRDASTNLGLMQLRPAFN